uniref:Uncharacterized protein n=1 Tax=Arundo donax TaxID=35708 RepID=A0A0A9DNV8_ARUDO
MKALALSFIFSKTNPYSTPCILPRLNLNRRIKLKS